MKRISIVVLVIALVASAITLVNCLARQREPISVESEFIYALTGSYENDSSQLLKIDSASREILKTVGIAGFATRVRVGDHIYVSNGEYITVYDEDLNKLAIHERATVDFATDGSYLYVLGDKALHVIEFADPSDPALVSSLSFNKTGHDVIFQDNKLYILDNIMYPIYLYMVDVTDPQRPELFEHEMWGINVHLSAQEVTDKWFVVEGYTRMSDRGAILRVFETTPPVKEMSAIQLSEYCRIRRRLTQGVDTGLIGDLVSAGNYVYISKLHVPVAGLWGDRTVTKCDLEVLAVELKHCESLGKHYRLRLERGKDFDRSLRPPLVKDGDLLYYGGTEGIWLVDIRNPVRPSRAGIIRTDYPVVSLELSTGG